MARKWERMIEKNTKQLNKQRAKSGKSQIEAGKDAMEIYQGRSIFLPFFLLVISVLLLFTGQSGVKDGLYWFTFIAYFLLAAYFFLRRPYLKIGKSRISSRKFSRDKIVEASDISQIVLQKGYVMFSLKGKKAQMIFSRLFNRYDTDKIADRLKEFANQNNIPVKEE